MQLTKALFDQINPGKIFRVVTTDIHNMKEFPDTWLTFVCVKARVGFNGKYLWAIYAASGSAHPNDIANYGTKVRNKEEIQSICHCDDEVLAMYRD